MKFAAIPSLAASLSLRGMSGRSSKWLCPHAICCFSVVLSGDRLCVPAALPRRADIFLGVPFNIASYALLTMMMAKVTGLRPGEFVHTLGDVHLYRNHFDQAREQLRQHPRPLPRLQIRSTPKSMNGFNFEDFQLEGYDPHPPIKAPVAV